VPRCQHNDMSRPRRRSTRPYIMGFTYLLTVVGLFHAFSLPATQLQHDHLNESITPSKSFSLPAAHDDHFNESRPILFVHFHKSGGTGVCQAMRLHQKQLNITDMLRNQDMGKIEVNNCNTELTHPHLNDGGFHSVQTCRMLELYTMDESGIPFQRNNFLAVEIPMADAMPCEGFRSLALMREPISRCLSHLHFQHFSERTVTQWINRKLKGNAHKDFFLSGYHSINNMVIRQLLGRTRYIDVTPIDEEDFQQAKARVDLFDAFIPLEYLRHEKILGLLESVIPEYYEGLINTKDHVVNKNENVTLEYTDAFLQILAKENEYDTRLYHYILEKYEIDEEN